MKIPEMLIVKKSKFSNADGETGSGQNWISLIAPLINMLSGNQQQPAVAPPPPPPKDNSMVILGVSMTVVALAAVVGFVYVKSQK